jgi:uncharacterized protein YegJ (DUF2314 family)
MLLRSLLLASVVWTGTVAPTWAEHATAREVRRPGASPAVFQVADQDREMRTAVGHARSSVGQFIRALRAKRPGDTNFMVKKPFRQGDRTEHLWLTGLTFTGHRFHGRVDNRPRLIKGLKLGSYCSVEPGEITDWAYLHEGKLVGGYTMRALYARLSPKQQKEFQHETIFQIR